MSILLSKAAQFMNEADYDLVAAKRIAREQIAHAPDIARLLWESAIDQLLENVWRSGREVHWKRAEGVHVTSERPSSTARPLPQPVLRKGETAPPSKALMAGTQQALTGAMLFEMPGGTHIGQWNKSQLDTLADKVISQSRSAMRTGFFFRAVAGMLKLPSDRVCEVLTNNDLERLMRQQGIAQALPV